MLKMHHDTVQTTPTTNDRRPLAPIPRILVVDGNDDTRELYRHWFQLSGCHVVEASDGRDALTKALVSPPSLVVTEISLPFLDGYALCEILRRDRATADVPILVLTAARPADMDRARRAGADIVVATPTTPDHLVSLSRRLLDEVKHLRGHAAATEARAAAPSGTSESGLAHVGERRRTVLTKAHSRFTTATPRNTTGVADLPVGATARSPTTEAISAASAIVSGSSGITTRAPLVALSSIASAPANFVTLAQYLNGQTQKRSNGQSACGEWLR